jgi:hypothetical protein
MLPALLDLSVLAFHQGGGGTASLPMLLAVLGVIATPIWLLLSTMAWRTTLLAAGAAWAVGIVLLFVL